MAIRITEKMSDADKKKTMSQKDNIKNDVFEALENKIESFEFIGDYTFKTLKSYARDLIKYDVNRQIISDIYYEEKRKINALCDPIKDEEIASKNTIWHDCKFSGIAPEYNRWFRLYDKKEKDRIHVFCEIDYKLFDKFKKDVYDYLQPNENYISKFKKTGLTAKISPNMFGLRESEAKEVIGRIESFSIAQTEYATALIIRENNIREARKQLKNFTDNKYSNRITKLDYNAMAAEYEDIYDPIDEENLEPRWIEIIEEHLTKDDTTS